MAARNRVANRITGLFVRWGLIKHPYGREYVRDHYTLSGRRVPDTPREGGRKSDGAAETVVVTTALLLLSLLATGVLLG